MKNKRPDNSFSGQLIRLEKEKERIIIEKLRIEWQTSSMNFLSFEEWRMI